MGALNNPLGFIENNVVTEGTLHYILRCCSYCMSYVIGYECVLHINRFHMGDSKYDKDLPYDDDYD